MKFSKTTLSFLSSIALAYSVSAGAAVVNIDSTLYGFDARGAGPGTLVVGQTYSLDYLDGWSQRQTAIFSQTFEAGTYSWSNAIGQPGALYDGFGLSAVRDTPTTFAKDSNGNLIANRWKWAFAAFDDSNKSYLFGFSTANTYDKNQMLTDSAGLSGTFTLTKRTTIDFAVVDYHLADNTGGVSVNITPVPEPESFTMILAGLGFAGFAARRKSK